MYFKKWDEKSNKILSFKFIERAFIGDDKTIFPEGYIPAEKPGTNEQYRMMLQYYYDVDKLKTHENKIFHQNKIRTFIELDKSKISFNNEKFYCDERYQSYSVEGVTIDGIDLFVKYFNFILNKNIIPLSCLNSSSLNHDMILCPEEQIVEFIYNLANNLYFYFAQDHSTDIFIIEHSYGDIILTFRVMCINKG